MTILNLVALALLASAGISAGPCRVPSSAATTSVGTEITATISTNNEVTKTATKSFTTTESMEIHIEAEISTDEPTSTIETFTTQIATTTKIDDTTLITTTTGEDIATSITNTAAATTTVGARVIRCDSLPSPYVASNGDRYEIKCNWKYTGWQPIGPEPWDITFEKCIKACTSAERTTALRIHLNIGLGKLEGREASGRTDTAEEGEDTDGTGEASGGSSGGRSRSLSASGLEAMVCNY